MRIIPSSAGRDNLRNPRTPLACYLGPVRSVLMVVNGRAGNAAGVATAEVAATRLDAHGIRVLLKPTQSADEANDLITSHRSKVESVVAVGGDGTVRGILPGVMESGLPIGLIPRGTANVVARELGISRKPEEAADALAHGQPLPWDLGIANDHYFLAMVGAGIDAEVVQRVGPQSPKLVRTVLGTASQWIRASTYDLEVLRDGQLVQDPVKSVVLCNTKNYGGWFSLAPNARPDDGKLEMVSFLRTDRRALIRVVSAAARKKPIAQSLLQITQGTEFEIRSKDPNVRVPVQADGDPLDELPLSVKLKPGALRIIRTPSPTASPTS